MIFQHVTYSMLHYMRHSIAKSFNGLLTDKFPQILQCESGFIESPLSEINCWFFSDCWVRPHTSNHLCLPSPDWPAEINKIPDSKYWPITRRKTKMIRRVGANPAIWKKSARILLIHLTFHDKRIIRYCASIFWFQTQVTWYYDIQNKW